MLRKIESDEVGALIPDKATVAIGGAGAGHAVPDKILEGIGKYFQSHGRPNDLRTIHPCGIGDNDQRGLNHIAFPGLIHTDIGGFWGNAPKMVKLARENKIRGFNLPQGVLTQLMRTSASGKPGMLTKVGLQTFVDPRIEAGRINETTTEDLVQLMKLDGEDYLFYPSFRIDIAIIRGTSVDPDGNLTMEDEVGNFAMLSMAQAAKVHGGIVIAQVKNIRNNRAEPRDVKVPGAFVDYVVQDENQTMTFITDFDRALINREAPYESNDNQLAGIKKIVNRRAAFELKPKTYINLGYGMSDGVPIVAKEKGIADDLTFIIEQGAIGGIPTTGLNFGAMYHPHAIVDDGYQFDFIQGGGLDIAYLGFAQVDKFGNVNSSRFGNVLTGCGGFIDISQNAKKVVFCGSFAAKSEQNISEKGIQVINPGRIKKFIDHVEQITFSGNFANEKGQEVLYVTERAVFRLSPKGLILDEIAPGIDLQRHVLDMMDFKPVILPEMKFMDPAIFSSTAVNTANDI